MSAMVPIVFPAWRTVWMTLDGILPLLERADGLLRRRARGNLLLPKLNIESTERFGLGIEALRLWTDGKPPADVSARPRIARNIYTAIAPVLGAAAWPRWLYLEHAFLDGSEGGDLLFSALAIRTMCEESQRLHSLDLGAGEIETLITSENPADHARLDLFLRLARASLDTPKNPLAIDTSSPDLEWAASARPKLQSAKQALNDYVHPNYGSHIAALFPERAAAPRILLEGVIAAYDSFFALSWTDRPNTGLSVPLSSSPSKSWPGVVRRFTKRVLPDMRKQTFRELQAEQISSEIQKVFEFTATVAWLTTDNAAAAEFLDAPDIAALIKSLRLPGQRGPGDRVDDKRKHYLVWDGASELDVLAIAMARRAEQMLIEAFPNGGPDRSQQQRWLHFITLALQLALTLDDVKVAAFIVIICSAQTASASGQRLRSLHPT